MARGYAAKREDYQERNKFELSKEHRGRMKPGPEGKTAEERLAELETARIAAGVPEVPKANITQLMRQLGIERLYRLASGVAHGMEWVMMAATLEPVADPVATAGTTHGMMSASEPATVAITAVAVGEADRAMTDLERYYGRA